MRSVIGVVAGYVIFAVSAALLFQISGQNPHGIVSSQFMMLSIVYGMIFSGADDLGAGAVEMPAEAMNTLPAPALSREPEARYMLDRARETAKRGQAVQAVAMLNRIVAVYKGTAAAGEAQAALDRPRQNLPLFPDGPFVAASKAGPAGSAPGAAPPPAARSGAPATGATPGPVPATQPPPRVAGRAGCAGR